MTTVAAAPVVSSVIEVPRKWKTSIVLSVMAAVAFIAFGVLGDERTAIVVWSDATDAIVLPNEHSAIVIDYKSGKRFGNEVKHAEQTQLYALNAVLRYPELEEVTTELWYLDVKELTAATFTRAQILRFRANFDRRGRALTE